MQPQLDRMSMSARTDNPGTSRRVVVGKVFETHDVGEALGVQVTTDGIRVGSSCLNVAVSGDDSRQNQDRCQLIHVSSSSELDVSGQDKLNSQHSNKPEIFEEEKERPDEKVDDNMLFMNISSEVRRHLPA